MSWKAMEGIFINSRASLTVKATLQEFSTFFRIASYELTCNGPRLPTTLTCLILLSDNA